MRRRSVLISIGIIAVVLAGGLYLTDRLLSDAPFREISRAEAATIRPALQRAAERDAFLLGEPARSHFCALHIYGTDHALEPAEQSYVYAWASCADVRARRNPSGLAFGEGIDVPVRFSVRGAGRSLTVSKLDLPGDGAAYGREIREFFPRQIERQILSEDAAPGDEDPQCTNLRAAQQRFGIAAPGVDAFEPKVIAHCPNG